MTIGRTSWHRSLLAGLLAVSAVGLGSTASAERVSARVIPIAAPLSVVAPGISQSPSVSGNGRFVVYEAAPPTEDGRTTTIWLNDRQTQSTQELTLPRQDVKLGNSVNPVISADGCAIAVITEMAYDLFRDDDGGTRWDVYRVTNPVCGGQANDWALISSFTNSDGFAEARGNVDATQAAALSSSGTIVAYVRPFESLSGVEDDNYLPMSVDVVDVTIPIDQPGRSEPAPGLPTEMAGTPIKYAGQISPAVSADGSIVTFVADATSNNPVPDWVLPVADGAPIPTQVFAWNRVELDPFAAVTLISQGVGGPADASAVQPAMSDNGRYIAFSSAATNLVDNADIAGCGVSCAAQLYVVDRDPDRNGVFDEPALTTMTVASAIPETDGRPMVVGNGASFAPSISADGTTVVFVSQASNLMAVQTPGGGGAGDGDLLIADLHLHQLRRAFDSPEPAPGANSHPRLSANGRLLVADSMVADRLLGDPTLTGRRVIAASYLPTLSIADVDLGTISVGVPGPEIFVNVVNTGPGSFLPTIVASDNPLVFAVNGGSCLDRAPVFAGSSCSVELQLTPAAAGLQTATLTVAEIGYGAIVLTAPLRGAGGEPALDAFPVGADFTPTVVGGRSESHIDTFGAVVAGPVPFTITNIGFGPAVINSVKVTGANPKDFVVTTNGCTGEIAPYVKCDISVAFTPTAGGRRTASVNFATTLGQYTSVFVAGNAFYTPNIVTNTTVKPGDDLPIGLEGFPANSAVVLTWSDDGDTPMTVLTDNGGRVLTNLRIRQSARPGTRVLVAQVPGGPSATSVVEIDRIRNRRG